MTDTDLIERRIDFLTEKRALLGDQLYDIPPGSTEGVLTEAEIEAVEAELSYLEGVLEEHEEMHP